MAKKTSKSQKGRTVVTFLLDRSGSMEMVKQETISGFNVYLDTLKKSGENIDMTLVQFDTEGMQKDYVLEPIKTVPELSDSTFQPRGGTPLIDAAYKTIKAVEAQEKAKGAKIVVCIQTDGQENSSHDHTWESLKALIAEKTKEGWQFNFMGCGIDAYDQSAKMGLTRGQTVSYGKDRASTEAVFAASASNTAMFSSGLMANTNYSGLQKAAAGDKYDVNLNGGVTPAKAAKPAKASFDLNQEKEADKASDFSL